MSHRVEDLVSSQAAASRALKVPLLDLRRQYKRIAAEVQVAVERVLASQHFIGGDEVAAFESEAAAYLGAADVVACASGTDALWLGLLATGIEPGDVVVTTPFSFFATASAILRAAAAPLFVDIDPATFNLDVAQVERRLAEERPYKLRAIEPVHLYGQCANMDAVRALAQEQKLVVLEDAAQAFGAGWRGQRAGALGTVAAFSFYPTKNLSAYGDGGCVAASSRELGDRLRRLRNHGTRERYFHDELGWNSRLDALQAAVLRVKLKHIDQWNNERRERAALYDRLFAAAGLAERVVLPKTAAPAHHIFHQYVVRVERRDALRKFLEERGITTEIYYPLPLHLQRCFRYLGHTEGDFPEAERASREVLALPMFPELMEEEQRYVVEAVASFYS
jgi:dTDP-4-amino-4,6-dideoxygalactose transaminase